jgi:hypothetical protein
MASATVARADTVDGRADAESPRWHWLAYALVGAALAIGIVLVVGGAPVPDPVTVVALAALLALAVNRGAFFPTELAVTTEAAVLLAAVVVFRDSSPSLGPLVVALLAGPLDVVHWRQHAFLRMAYNAGNRALTTITAAAVFAAIAPGPPTSGDLTEVRWLLAASVAAAAFASVEGAVGVLLFRLRSRAAWRAAARVELPLDALTVPAGLVGALAGWLVLDVGWWAGVLVLVPVGFLPEMFAVPSALAIGRRVGRAAVTALPALLAIFSLAVVLPAPPLVPLVCVASLALAAGLDLRLDRPVPPTIAALVAGALLVGGDGFAIVAAVAAVVATAAAWVGADRASWWAPILAGALALGAAALFGLWPTRIGASAIACAFVVAVGARPSVIVWTLPLVGLFSALSVGWGAGDAAGALVLVVGTTVSMGAIADSGSPLWSSRALGPRASRWPHRPRVVVAGATALALTAALAATAGAGDARVVLSAVAAGAGAMLGAVAVTLTRQWRFRPRRRARDLAALLVAIATMTLVYPDRALSGDGWSVVVLAGGLAIAVIIAWPLAALATVAATRAASAGERAS